MNNLGILQLDLCKNLAAVMAFCLFCLGCNRVNPAGKLRQAIADADAQHYDEALFNTDICLRYDQNNVNALILNSYCLLVKEDSSETAISKAIYNLDKATRLEPERFDAWYILGWALYGNGKYQEAIDALEKALKLLPSGQKDLRGNLLCMLAISYEKNNLLNKSYSRMQPLRAIPAYSRNAALYNSLGILAVKDKKYTQAMEYFNEGLKLSPKNAAILQNMAVVYDLHLNNVPMARKYYIQCLTARYPNDDAVSLKIQKRLAAIVHKK